MLWNSVVAPYGEWMCSGAHNSEKWKMLNWHEYFSNFCCKFAPKGYIPLTDSLQNLAWGGSTRFAPSRQITGSAVVLHCCKAHAKINGKIENLTPCKIVTHEDFNLKLGTRDYVADITHQATLGSNRPSGGVPPNRGNITPCDFFGYTRFFSRSCPPEC